MVFRGLIANEIFRRVNPEGATLGEFLDKERQNVEYAKTTIDQRRKSWTDLSFFVVFYEFYASVSYFFFNVQINN